MIYVDIIPIWSFVSGMDLVTRDDDDIYSSAFWGEDGEYEALAFFCFLLRILLTRKTGEFCITCLFDDGGPFTGTAYRARTHREGGREYETYSQTKEKGKGKRERERGKYLYAAGDGSSISTQVLKYLVKSHEASDQVGRSKEPCLSNDELPKTT